MKFTSSGDYRYGIYWGSNLKEEATSISVDNDNKQVYVVGFSESVGTLSSAQQDMIIIKLTTDLAIQWSRRIGGNKNDKAMGVEYFNNHIYIIGHSDSDNWNTASYLTDIVLMRLTTDGTVNYAFSIPGT